ncbi:MAG: hypothetical protein IPK64_19925 [bacterium]|nr:hypothetical protein [bacterium]
MGSIWSASAVTPAATDRIPVDVSSSGAPSRWTGQNVADAASRIGVTLNALGSINSNTEIDLANGAFVTATITGSLTFTFSNPPATGQGMQFVLVLTDGGSAVVTWPGAVTWTGGTAPTLRASGVDVLRFYTSNGGTNWYGELAYDEQSIDAGAILTGTIDAARLPAGTTSAAGALELATVAEAEAGTDTARAVTPEGVAAAIAALSPGGSPGGSTTEVQFNNAGVFDGMSGTAWDDTNRCLTVTGATVTTSKPILGLSQTWNAGAVAFTGLLFNVTNTVSAATSKLLDLQVGGSSVFSVGRGADLGAGPEGGSSSSSARFIFWGSQSMIVQTGGGSTLRPFAVTSGLGGTGRPALGACVISSGYLGFGNAAANSTPDAYFTRDAAGIIAMRDSTTAQTLRVYGTYTDSSNHVRGSMAASSTAVTLAAETAGTGADNVPLNLNSAGTSPVKAGNPLGYQSYTVATVPSASAAGAGANIYVSDESGGAVPAFSDGTDWRRYTDRAVIS